MLCIFELTCRRADSPAQMEAPGLVRIEFLDANLARHKRAEIEAFVRAAVAQVRAPHCAACSR